MVKIICKWAGGLHLVPVVLKPVMVKDRDSIMIHGRKKEENNKPAEKKASHFEYRIPEIEAQK